VCSHLKLFAGLLVDVWTAQNGVSLNARRKRNRTKDLRTGALGLLDDLLRRRVE
jgi:hypothetical protein